MIVRLEKFPIWIYKQYPAPTYGFGQVRFLRMVGSHASEEYGTMYHSREYVHLSLRKNEVIVEQKEKSNNDKNLAAYIQGFNKLSTMGSLLKRNLCRRIFRK